jgi:RsmE family RNA methyltransferase
VNLLLLSPDEVSPDGQVCLTGRRHLHAREVLRVQAGETLRVGVKGGRCGTATVLTQHPERLELQVVLDEAPPQRPGVDLILAIPRPKALKRVIPAVASLGVDRVVLINAARVEKSYFDSKVLASEFLGGLIDLGLEQARDTVAPTIEMAERFKPFIEDRLGSFGDAVRLLPHPAAPHALSPVVGKRVLLAIGPDGGWVPYEVELLVKHGFAPVSLGARILRVEVAVPAAIGAVRAG